jgi:hypothetical protein
MALIYAMLLGADCIDDSEVLRAGRTGARLQRRRADSGGGPPQTLRRRRDTPHFVPCRGGRCPNTALRTVAVIHYNDSGNAARLLANAKEEITMTHLTHRSMPRLTRNLVVLLALACTVLTMTAVKPAVSHAAECSNYLPQGDWPACGEQAEMVDIYVGINYGSGDLNDCAGAMVYSGGKASFPWGWKCGNRTIVEEFPGGVKDYAAAYNDSNGPYDIWIHGI